MWFTKIVVFRIEPFLQVGLLMKNEYPKRWKRKHFQNNFDSVTKRYGSIFTKYVNATNDSVIKPEIRQLVKWINPRLCNAENRNEAVNLRTIFKHFQRLQEKYKENDLWKREEEGIIQWFHRLPDKSFKRIHYLKAQVRQGYVSRVDPRRVCVHPTSGGEIVPFILDTGSEITCCHASWASHPWDVPQGVLATHEPYTIMCANGTVLNQSHHPIIVRMKFGHITVLQKVFFFDNLESNLLGMDFVAANECSLLISNKAGYNLQFGTDPKLIPAVMNSRIPVYPVKDVALPPGESELECKVRELHCAHVQITTIDNLSVPQIAPIVYDVDCARVRIKVNNPLPFAIDLRTEDEVGLAKILQGSVYKTKSNQVFFVQEQKPPNIEHVLSFKNDLLKEKEVTGIQKNPIFSDSDTEDEDLFMPMKKIEKEEILKDVNIKPAGLFDEDQAQEAVNQIMEELIAEEEKCHEDFLEKGLPEVKGYDFKINDKKKAEVIVVPEEEFVQILRKNVEDLFPKEFVEEMILFFMNDCTTLIPKHSLDIGRMRKAKIEDFGFPDNCKVKTPAYNLVGHEREIAESMLQDMVNHKILVKGRSAYYSAIFIIPKQTPGQYRLVTVRIMPFNVKKQHNEKFLIGLSVGQLGLKSGLLRDTHNCSNFRENLVRKTENL